MQKMGQYMVRDQDIIGGVIAPEWRFETFDSETCEGEVIERTWCMIFCI